MDELLLTLVELRLDELPDTLRLELLEELELRVDVLLELRVDVLLELRVDELLELLDALELLELRVDELLFDTLLLADEPDTLRCEFELLTLRVGLVLLGRSYVLPD